MRGAPKSTVTALWNKSRQHLGVFMTDAQGIVWSSWWEAKVGWQYWSPIHPEQKAAPGAKISASWVAYSDNHLDLFMTASDGTVWSCFWEGASGWQSWFPVSPTRKMAPRSACHNSLGGVLQHSPGSLRYECRWNCLEHLLGLYRQVEGLVCNFASAESSTRSRSQCCMGEVQ
jgi:hypothetical protein